MKALPERVRCSVCDRVVAGRRARLPFSQGKVVSQAPLLAVYHKRATTSPLVRYDGGTYREPCPGTRQPGTAV